MRNWESGRRGDGDVHTIQGGDKQEDGNVQVRTLIHALDNEAQNIFKTFDFTVEENDYYVTVIEKCDAYFIPKGNTISERACFHQRQQKVKRRKCSFERHRCGKERFTNATKCPALDSQCRN